jgi:hypothetical protein
MLGTPYRRVNGQSNAGAAQVYTYSNNSWSGPVELNLGANANAGDFLGNAVALSGNGTTALVGAPYRHVSGQLYNGGAAEVFTFSNGNWSGPTELAVGTNGGSGDSFGDAVALSDNGETALVGMIDQTANGQTDAGDA